MSDQFGDGTMHESNQSDGGIGQPMDGSERSNTVWELPVLDNPKVPKTGYSRLKALENKGISVSWKPVTTAENAPRCTGKSMGQKSRCRSRFVSNANDTKRQDRDRGRRPRKVRGRRLFKLRIRLSARLRNIRLRKLLRFSDGGLYGRFRVTGPSDVSRGAL